MQAFCVYFGGKYLVTSLKPLAFAVIVFQANRSPIPYTPLCLSKAVKNATEIQGMRMAHVRTTSVRSLHSMDPVCLLCTLLFISS